jgi:hypothetical protein
MCTPLARCSIKRSYLQVPIARLLTSYRPIVYARFGASFSGLKDRRLYHNSGPSTPIISRRMIFTGANPAARNRS